MNALSRFRTPSVVLSRTARPVCLCAALGMAPGLPSPAGAQDNPFVFELLPMTGAPLQVGQSRTAALESTDYRLPDGMVVKAFALVGVEGDPVVIDAVSDGLDTYLYLVGPGFDQAISDDDSGGACNARITEFLPATGTYTVVVGGFGGSTGGFTLSVSARREPAAVGDCGGDGDIEAALSALEPVGTLVIGEATAGTLDASDGRLSDGSSAEAWLLSGSVGGRVYVDLVSDDFDSLLFVLPPEGASHEMDDDSGGACNARLIIDFGSEQPYRVVANSLSPGAAGAYRLIVSEQPRTAAPGPCG